MRRLYDSTKTDSNPQNVNLLGGRHRRNTERSSRSRNGGTRSGRHSGRHLGGVALRAHRPWQAKATGRRGDGLRCGRAPCTAADERLPRGSSRSCWRIDRQSFASGGVDHPDTTSLAAARRPEPHLFSPSARPRNLVRPAIDSAHSKPLQVQRLLDQRLDPHRHPLRDHLQVQYPLLTPNIVPTMLSLPAPTPPQIRPGFPEDPNPFSGRALHFAATSPARTRYFGAVRDPVDNLCDDARSSHAQNLPSAEPCWRCPGFREDSARSADTARRLTTAPCRPHSPRRSAPAAPVS